jgi:energy-coupling factor transporter ATP-binding protein EcfA2
MRITKVELKNFKRFTDLTIDGIPADTRLVLLIGSNGSGKSSVFDAFEYVNKLHSPRIDGGITPNLRAQMQLDHANISQKLKIKFRKFSAHSETDVKITATLPIRYEDGSKVDDVSYISHIGQGTGETYIPLYYGRTSFRHIASLADIKPFSSDIRRDDNRPGSFAERDERFGDDIGFITRQISTTIFRENFSSGEIQTKYIQPINEALSRVFGGESATRISFLEIIPPGDGKPAKLTFTKGSSEIGYDDLSAGEKEIFNIIFNLFTRSSQYTDTIYFFDELDLWCSPNPGQI